MSKKQRKLVKGIRIFLRKKKRQYVGNRYKTLPQHEKQSLVEYRNFFYKIWKNKTDLQIKSD